MDCKKLGHRIKIARVKLRLTQTKLAKLIGKGQKSISRYETGLTTPELETLEHLSIVLNQNIEYFTSYEEIQIK